MGKVGELGVSCPPRGDVEEEGGILMHQYCPVLGWPPWGDIAQGQVSCWGKWMSRARRMPALGCGFHLGRNQFVYSGHASGIKITCMWYELTSGMGLCKCTLNTHNTAKSALDCIRFSFWLQLVLSKSLFCFTSGKKPVFSLAVILWPTKSALSSSNFPAAWCAPSPRPKRPIMPNRPC